MRTRSRRRTAVWIVFVICSCLLLCGTDCDLDLSFSLSIPWFEMEDAGNYWEKAGPDAAMSGRWFVRIGATGEGIAVARFRKEGEAYVFEMSNEDEEGLETWELTGRAKSLTVDGGRFMLWKPAEWEEKNAEDEEAAEPAAEPVLVWHYTVREGELRFYGVKDGVLEKAAKDARWKDVIEHDEEDDAGMPKLDAKMIVFLKWLAADPANWNADDAWIFTRKPPEKPKEE